MLQYSNVYIPTPEINQLMHDKRLQKECLDYIGKKGKKDYFLSSLSKKQFLVGLCHVICHVTHQNYYDHFTLTVINVCNKFGSIWNPFIATNG